MSEQTDKPSGKHLSAKELLRNKGICVEAWNEWEESSRALPKTGAKQFEPNGSWLQNKQIEKGLKSRKFLLGIERVERSSQLASAEWLPEQKKARVTKKTGQEWVNYGLEVNSNLYLIPEEALILLETECLELTWDGIPLSIQQAYELLIDSAGSDCSLDEYRVYSQLTRLGYRLQRFCYDKSQLERATRSEENQQRKKVIIDPENGLWMAGNNGESAQSSRNHQKPEIDNDVKEIVDDIVTSVNGTNKETGKAADNKSERLTKPEDTNTEEKQTERKCKNQKVEIVSEQTILPPIKIVKDVPTSEHLVSKWPGARIQRNVKLLPKRNDKLPVAAAGAETSSGTPNRRRRGSMSADSPDTKKSKHEVIDLSDDEIEEIPRPMSRMEMLNCLPNIACQIYITENISRRYLPRGVRPQRTYRYDSRRLRNMHDNDRSLRTNSEPTRAECRNGSQRNTSENDSSESPRNSLLPYPRCSNLVRPNYFGNNNLRNANRGSYFPHQANQYSSSSMMMRMPGGICMQQISVGPGGWQNSQSMITGNRWASFQMNMFRNAAVMGYAMRSVFMQGSYQPNLHPFMPFTMQQQQVSQAHRYLERPLRGSWIQRFQTSTPTRPYDPRQNANNWQQAGRPLHHDSECEIYQATFTKLPGASSWVELKQKWRDAKTITIDDEESGGYDGDDSSDIQVVDQAVRPLVGARNARNFSEIYLKLRIIKSAPERTVRRKKSDFKISYNVYSSRQNFRKANPGLPMFHLVVTSQKEKDLLQPVELNRLQQDGKGAPIMFAHVSNSSITYLQPGIVSLPNLV